VWYSEDADDLTGIAEGPERTTEHRVRIEGLQPNTTYYFQIESVPSSTSSKTENPAIMSFRTVAVGQQSVHNQKASIAQRGLSTFGEEETVKR
jgi:phosphodiesterase/alkaline phosphatase D-like protein